MSEPTPLTLSELFAGSAARRESLDARVRGEVPDPVIETDPDAKGDPVDTAKGGHQILGKLTEAERASVIERAEAGDSLALDIVAKAIESTPAPPQAGDAGARGRGDRAVSPWVLANENIMRAFRAGRSRQTGQRF